MTITQTEAAELARTDMEHAKQRLALLLAEAAALPGELGAAIRDGDVDAVAKHRRRLDVELPAELFAAKADALRSEIVFLQARQKVTETPLAEAKARLEEARNAFEAAQRNRIAAENAYWRLSDRVRGDTQSIGSLRTQLDALLAEAEQAGKGTLVRSLWQA